jgi:hypothetical protein
MITCANCSSNAEFTYALTDSYGIHYCGKHVPKFLNNHKRSGMLPLRTFSVEVEPTIEVSKPTKKKSKIAVEEPVVDGTVVEETTVADIETVESADADNS